MVVRVNNSGTGKNMLYPLWRTSLLAGLSMVLCKMAAPTAAAPVIDGVQAIRYLEQYGYLSPSVMNNARGMLIHEKTYSKAIADFQSFTGLNATGKMNSETSDMMMLPRCGVKDKMDFDETRPKRYVIEASRWRMTDLTYNISKYPEKLNPNSVDFELSKAFNLWSGYTDLTFTQKRTGRVHIDIRFEKGAHEKCESFDGLNGVVAHAFFPQYGGAVHFDDSEPWTINSQRGINLLQTAAHEFGHSLGLKHSDLQSALMAPTYRKYIPSFTLDTDDIEGIEARYGRKTQSDIGEFGQTRPVICTDGKVDTIFNSANGSTFAFKGDYYWLLTDDGIAAGYPRLIARAWPGLPGHIDAAFTHRNGHTFFFRGSQFWRYNGQRVDGEYPQKIREGFNGIPDNIDAALVYADDGKIYFYKGTNYWQFDPTNHPPVKNTYPMPISHWVGVPDNINAAIQYTNEYTYFFKDGDYYRFNNRMVRVDAASPAYPRSAAYWWFGCKSAPAGTVGDKTLQAIASEDEVVPKRRYRYRFRHRQQL